MYNSRQIERNLTFRKPSGQLQRDNSLNRAVPNTPRIANQTRDFDVNYYERGKEWRESGMSLDGASDTFRNNINFVKGYNKSDQLQRIENRRIK